MDVVHFTPGSLDPDNVRRDGTVAHLPLASGHGDFELSCLDLSPGGHIAIVPAGRVGVLLVVGGRGAVIVLDGTRVNQERGTLVPPMRTVSFQGQDRLR
jgi:hypothetical protein